MFNFFGSNKNKWDLLKSHKTLKVRNRPINIDDRYILYSTDYHVGENGIVLYDVNNDTCNVIKYPSNIRVEYHSYCKYKDYIYIINKDATIIVFNLKTKQFQQIQNTKNKQVIGAYSACINIEGTDIIHIFGGSQNQHHIIYDIIENKYVKKINFRLNMENPSIIYLKQQKKMIIFCGSFVFIGHNTSNKCEWNWTTSNTLKIPNAVRDCGYILYANQYLVFFGGCASNKTILNNIYLINLETNQIQNISYIQCPNNDKYHSVLIKNKIHLFGLFNDKKHYSLPLNKVLKDANQSIIDYNIKKEIKIDQKEEEKQIEQKEEKQIINLKKRIETLQKENETLKNKNIALKIKVENMEKQNSQINAERNMKIDINNEVAVWLNTTVKLPQYIELFMKNGINDLFVVQAMTEYELEHNVGITIFGHRKRILIYIQKLNQNDNEGKHIETAFI